MTKRKPTTAPDAATAPKNAVDPIQVFAEKLRDHKGLESRWAVMQENRVEYFRGKDLAPCLRNNPDLRKNLGDKFAQCSEEEIGDLLLRKKMILRCERVVKTLRPGKKKLSKWPARLELCGDQNFSEDDAFYAWSFERKRPLWQTVLSFLLPIVTLACCLFHLFPLWCKLVVMYLCLTLLVLIFGVLIVRGLVFASLWILLGKRVWFFPNINAEDASFREMIKFWPEPAKEDEKPPKWTTRLAMACLTGAIVWFCVRHAPDEAARARYHKGMSNIIDEVLEWSPRLAISGKVEKVEIANATVSSPEEQPEADSSTQQQQQNDGAGEL